MEGMCASGAGAAGASMAAALQFFAAAQCMLSEPWPPQADVVNGSSFDFIIVGGGTAGSTLAARLAQAYFKVLLVEAGGDPPQESIIPGFRELLKNSPYDWNFTTVDDGYSSQGLAGQHQRQPRGRMLGGSGSLNDMVYSRGHPTDYYEWAVMDYSWNWTYVLPYFRKTERMTDERITRDEKLMEFHGQFGEIEVSGKLELDTSSAKFLEAFSEMGFKIVDDMTFPYEIGAGRFSHTVREGRRDSSAVSLLNKAPNKYLHVLKDTIVTKIVMRNNTAIGITAESNTNVSELVFYAKKEVILSAGTFNTAKLLLLSGIGPESHLKDVDIEVIRDLPVGDNLHDHIMVVNYLAVDNGTCSTSKSSSYFDMVQYFYNSSGSLSYSDSVGAYLPKKNGQDNVPHFAIYTTCIPAGLMLFENCFHSSGLTRDDCLELSNTNLDQELITVAVVLLKPKSRGKVRLASNNFKDDPLIYSGTFSNLDDLEEFPETVVFALSIANTSYFRSKNARLIDLNGKCNGSGLDLVRCQVLESAMSAWHSVGTAAMGGVVDTELKVLGVKRLRVVDASVMPTIVRGNTNAPVVMIAEKAADIIKKAYSLWWFIF